MNLQKSINTNCCCGLHMTYIDDVYIVLFPCEHIFHRNCFFKKAQLKCPLCNHKVEKIVDQYEAMANSKKYKQNLIDIIAVKPFFNTSDISYLNLTKRSLILSRHLTDILNSKNETEINNSLTNILYICGIKIIKEGNIYDKNCVYVINHNSYLDPIIIYFLTQCGFVGSEKFIKKSAFGKKALKLVPLVPITRGKKGNTVDKIKKYIKDNDRSIGIFPEGMITHPKILTRFRTGAFRIGYPVQPVVINYDPVISGEDMGDFMLKLFTQKEIKIEVKFLPVMHQPFNEKKIEECRSMMALHGNLLLSRVSNKDISDEK